MANWELSNLNKSNPVLNVPGVQVTIYLNANVGYQMIFSLDFHFISFALRNTNLLCSPNSPQLITKNLDERDVCQMLQGPILRSSWAAHSKEDEGPLCTSESPSLLLTEAGRWLRDVPHQHPGARPTPAVLFCQHLAFVTSWGLGSGKSGLPKKVGALVQFG